MRAGSLRHRVHLQRNESTVDPVSGKRESQWKTYAVVWAEIKPATGREADLAHTFTSNVPSVIRLRYRADVTAKHRVQYGCKIYSILSATSPDEMRWETELHVVEVMT